MNSNLTALRHDIVVFGATSFVGQILCRYLLQPRATLGDRGAFGQQA